MRFIFDPDTRSASQSGLFHSRWKHFFLCTEAGTPGRTGIRLLQQPGVLGFAASSAKPTAISDEEISVLRTATESLKAEPHPYLSNGDSVRIVAGPLVGVTGILTRRKQEYRVVLSIEAIMRSIVVEVSEFDIEPQEKRR